MTDNPLLASLNAAVDHAGGTDAFATDVYAALFGQHPATRVMFPSGLADQRDRFVVALVRILTHAYDTDTGDLHVDDKEVKRLQAMAVDHLKYGARNEHYDAVGDSLVFVLATHLYDAGAWTQDVLDLWTAAYGAVAAVMTEAADAWLNAGNPRWVDGVIARMDRDGPGQLVVVDGLLHRTAADTHEPGDYPVPVGRRVSVCTKASPGDWTNVTVRNVGDRSVMLRLSPNPRVPGSLALLNSAPGDLVRLEPPFPSDVPEANPS